MPPAHPDVEIVEATKAFERFLRVDVFRFRHRLFSGEWSALRSYDVLRRGQAASVVLYDPDRESVVLVEQFRPGVMARLGLDYQAIRAVNPDVIYCSITGFGAGTGAALPGYDLLVQALGGLMSITGSPDGEPQKVGVALVDVLTGLFA